MLRPHTFKTPRWRVRVVWKGLPSYNWPFFRGEFLPPRTLFCPWFLQLKCPLCWILGGAAHCELSPFPPLCVRVRVPVWQRNICAYAVVIVVKMAEGETEKEYDTLKATDELRERFQGLTTALKESPQPSLEASLIFCQEFCQVSTLFSPRSSREACSPSGFLAEDARLLQQCS